MKNKSLVKGLLFSVATFGVFAGNGFVKADTKKATDAKIFAKTEQSSKTECKFATVSSIKIGNQYTKVADLQKELEKNAIEIEATLKKLAEEYETLQKEYLQLAQNDKKETLTEEAKKEHEKILQNKLTILKEKEQNFTSIRNESEQKLIAIRDEGSKDIALTIKATTKEIANKESVMFVIDSDNPSVFYANDSLDITDKVLKKLNDDAAALKAKTTVVSTDTSKDVKASNDKVTATKTQSSNTKGIKQNADAATKLKQKSNVIPQQALGA